ncbi:hypothetical protein TRIATDRAFT_299496 [Trichoderma atroviride IMI 206040]|uniref:Uncharacterized protein n=1 Tax=Hypocrea atroviridis (strain ATCC 20476 / IMI 206040) TaxID=452589 RepID=G9NT88_HYPAI|nr:uncharacterized protein TRIATDRAFT_299496 [Trichoderma atroviride IMI 206040]EHK45935.1 hypothetical protein TRIATDRAFT_299496 [Trichoderma atroviride IMI 206040]
MLSTTKAETKSTSQRNSELGTPPKTKTKMGISELLFEKSTRAALYKPLNYVR